MTEFDIERALHDDSVGMIEDDRTAGSTLLLAFEEIRNIDALDQARVCRDLRPVVRHAVRAGRAPTIQVHYGADVRIDRAHAERLARFPNVESHAHPGGHNISKSLRDRGELDDIIAAVLRP